VTRSSGVGTASVSYATSNGSAQAGSDYTARSGVLEFAAGVTAKNIAVPIANDGLIEGTENFYVSLSSPVNGSLGAQSSAVVNIVDNDSSATATVAFEVVAQSVREGAGKVTLRVIRTSSVGAASVNFATANLAAVAGADYVAQTGTLSFAAGVSVKTIVVTLVNDTVAEPSKTFKVTLSSPVGIALGTNKVNTVTILDDD
jgi:hypothetical protein